MYIVLGDWSDDGHGKSDKVLVETNYEVDEMQEAYKKSCRMTGISFNHDEDFTGVKKDYREAKRYHICTEYEDTSLSEECVDILRVHGCPLEDFCYADEGDVYIDHDQFLGLLMWFVSLSLPDFKWEKVVEKDDIPCFNGYWGDLNVQFGYGLYC